jgi:hypothetical protein
MTPRLSRRSLLAAGAAFGACWLGGRSVWEFCNDLAGHARTALDGAAPVWGGPSLFEVRRLARERTRGTIEWANAQCQAASVESLSGLAAFFNDTRARTGEFADDVLGWGAKWRIAADYLPGTRGDRFEEYLRQKFEEHVFTPYDLEQKVGRSVADYLDAVATVENQMLVRLRADVADLPVSALPALENEAAVTRNFQAALARAESQVQGQLKWDVTAEVVSLVGGEVLTMAAVRLGVSAGLLTAGATTTLQTLGIGLVVGLIFDQIVSWVWDWWRNPRGELAAELSGRLSELERLIVEGDGESPGLRRKLAEMDAERCRLREQIVMTMINAEETS